jgi:hypothetical protein
VTLLAFAIAVGAGILAAAPLLVRSPKLPESATSNGRGVRFNVSP